MENASKALIIAGAIVISLLIITLGTVIFKQAAGIINTDAMSAVEMEAFNTKFTQYEGNQRGSKIKSLYNDVLQNNINQDSTDRKVKITSSCGNLLETATKLPELSIETGSKYEIWDICYYDGEAGNPHTLYVKRIE